MHSITSGQICAHGWMCSRANKLIVTLKVSKARRHFTELLKETKSFRATVKGDCMSPALKNESCVRVDKKRLYFPGDIVAVCMGPSVVVHRFLGYGLKNHVVALTRTDKNNVPDPSTSTKNILGKINQSIPIKTRLLCTLDWLSRCSKGLYRRAI